MLFLLGGVAILCGLLLLVYLFVNADPAKLARGLKWTGIGIAVVAALALLLVTEGRVAIFFAPLLPLLPALRRVRSLFRGGTRGPRTSRVSTVETTMLRMSLDHDTGAMTGTVLRGQFAGLRVEELGRGQLLDLLRECRAADEEAARLVEAYFDRNDPDWREAMQGGGGRAGAGASPRSSAAEMTVEEAYAVLGLAPGADEEAIRAAHRRLMMQLHPDHGGTDYLATQINRARDVLLRHR